MLQVPLKQSTPCDVVTPLSRFVTAEYSDAISTEHMEDFRKLQLLRNSAIDVKAPSDEGLRALITYHTQLHMLQPRLPVASQSSAGGLQLKFSWKDAFLKSKSAEQNLLAFERAACLFNAGALESHAAAGFDRSTDEGIKMACKHFQSAAGFFAFVASSLSKEYTGCGAMTPDLTVVGLGLSTQLMLAQAQACYYEMAVRKQASNGVKPSVLAKLSAQASAYFKAALEASRSPSLDKQLDESWPAHVHFQMLSFEAAAQYWQSLHVQVAAKAEGRGYAEEIARIRLAQAAAADAMALAATHKMGAVVTASVADLQVKLAANLGPAVEDNRTIYLEVEPSPQALAAIGLASMVKALPPALELPPGTAPLFGSLLPPAVVRAIEAARAQISRLASTASATSKQVTKDARSQLSSKGLPGSIAAQDDAAGFPEAVWRKVASVQEAGGDWAIKRRVNELDGGAQRAGDLLRDIAKRLQDEADADRAFSARCAGYRGDDSMAQFQGDAQHYQDLYSRARSSDASIRAQVASAAFAQDVALLAKSRAQLDGLLPRRDLLDDAVASADASALSRELMALADLLKQRDMAAAELASSAAAATAGLTAGALALAASGKPLQTAVPGGGSSASTDLEQHLAGLVAPVAALADAVNKSVAAQPVAMDRVMKENDIFDAARSKDSVTMGRLTAVMNVDRAATGFNEALAQLAVCSWGEVCVWGGEGGALPWCFPLAPRTLRLYCLLRWLALSGQEGGAFYSDLVGRLQQMSQTLAGATYARGLVRKDFEDSQGSAGDKRSMEASDAALARRLAEQLQMGDGAAVEPESPSAVTPAAAAVSPYAPVSAYATATANTAAAPLAGAKPPAKSSSGLNLRERLAGAFAPSPPVSPPPPVVMATPMSNNTAPPPFPDFNAPRTAPAAPPPPAYSAVACPDAPKEQDASRLVDMGFPRADVMAALAANNNDGDLALNQLLAN